MIDKQEKYEKADKLGKCSTKQRQKQDVEARQACSRLKINMQTEKKYLSNRPIHFQANQKIIL